MRRSLWPSFLLLCGASAALAADDNGAGFAAAPTDTVVIGHGLLVVHPFGHASLALEWNGRLVVVDPVGSARRYAHLPQPDLILITHRHGDHFDSDVVRDLAGEATWVITPPVVAESIPSCDPLALAGGDSATVRDIGVRAIPAANRSADRLDLQPPDQDNGYLIDLGGVRVFVSGDTEHLPAHAALGPVDVAFLSVNHPYTMSLDQALNAARAIAPRVLYPYHFRNRDGTFTDVEALQRGLQGSEVSEVRILDWY